MLGSNRIGLSGYARERHDRLAYPRKHAHWGQSPWANGASVRASKPSNGPSRSNDQSKGSGKLAINIIECVCRRNAAIRLSLFVRFK